MSCGNIQTLIIVNVIIITYCWCKCDNYYILLHTYYILHAADRKTLQRTVNTAAKIIGAPLPSILDIFLARCSSKTNSIVKDPTHPSHSLFQLLSSRRRYRSIRARSARLLNSFFPQAVRALNSDHPAPSETPCKPLPPETWTWYSISK